MVCTSEIQITQACFECNNDVVLFIVYIYKDVVNWCQLAESLILSSHFKLIQEKCCLFTHPAVTQLNSELKLAIKLCEAEGICRFGTSPYDIIFTLLFDCYLICYYENIDYSHKP